MSGLMTGPLLELRRLAVSFATDDGTVHAVDGIDLVAGSAAARWDWSANRAAARA